MYIFCFSRRLLVNFQIECTSIEWIFVEFCNDFHMRIKIKLEIPWKQSSINKFIFSVFLAFPFFQFNTINSMLTLNHCTSLHLWRMHIKLLNSDIKITMNSHGHISKSIYYTLYWNNLFSIQGIFVTTKSHFIDSIYEFILALFYVDYYLVKNLI